VVKDGVHLVGQERLCSRDAELGDLLFSVWSRAHSAPGKSREGRATPGRLIAVSATGPIYRGALDVAAIRVPVGLPLAQELAARAKNPKARVVSSLADRVDGPDLRARAAGRIRVVRGDPASEDDLALDLLVHDLLERSDDAV